MNNYMCANIVERFEDYDLLIYWVSVAANRVRKFILNIFIYAYKH